MGSGEVVGNGGGSEESWGQMGVVGIMVVGEWVGA